MINFISVISYFFVFSNKSLYKYSGYDQRFGNETIQTDKIKILFQKKELLNKLKSTKISVIEKVNLAEEFLEINKIKGFDINAGGLLNDFNN